MANTVDGDALEGGNYEVLRRRLAASATDLSDRAEALNSRRTKTFGKTELAVLGTERVRTHNNCVPRDLVALGDVLLFAYNVFLGLKTETRIEDVFDLHRLSQVGEGLSLAALDRTEVRGLLDSPQFVKDFSELHRFYKEARLVRVTILNERLLALFQTGRSASNVRGFRWGLNPNGDVEYIDNRGEEDHRFPPSHTFKWTACGREDHVRGRHPHINILDTIFVETMGGTLTIKVENNSEDGLGIYQEPVSDPRQSLDDAEFEYARLGALILLKVLPYQEKQWRYLVFNTRTQDVRRIDAIGLSCQELPEDHGIIFPGGYYLQTGELKIFDADVQDLVFERSVAAPNGEDVLYAFYHHEQGRYLLLPYNLIRKEVQTPLTCQGFTLFDDGRMLLSRSSHDEAARVHPLQIWQTPFSSPEHALARPSGGTFLEKIGNAELVRGISDVLSISRLAREEDPVRQTFEDLIGGCTRVLDTYHWLSHPECGEIALPLQDLKETTELVIDEFEKVTSLKAQARAELDEADATLRRLIADHRPSEWKDIASYLKAMTEIRNQRGHVITLRDIRYIDVAALERMEAELVEAFDHVSGGCVRFLLGGEALKPIILNLEGILDQIPDFNKATELEPLEKEVEGLAEGLGLLSEVVGGLDVQDPTERTQILEDISEAFSVLNRCRATLKQRKKALRTAEGQAEFAAQFRLLTQSVQNGVTVADTPEACDEQQSRLLVQLEDLEARFSDFDTFIADLAKQREDIIDAFGAKKQQLLDERQYRASNLASAANRILEGVERRAHQIADEDSLNAFFASDPMILKLRQIQGQLGELGENVKSEDGKARLKSAKQDALRNLRDKRDLFEGQEDLIRLGQHQFYVNTQPFELTILPRDEGMALHVSGTDYWEPIEDEDFLGYRDCWDQLIVSETQDVYRAEFLAYSILDDAERGEDRGRLDALLATAHAQETLLEEVRRFAGDRYDEGYERGVHDVDAAAILEKLLVLRTSAGVLRFPASARVAALLWWAFGGDLHDPGASWVSKTQLHRRAQSLGRLRRAFSSSEAETRLAGEIGREVARFVEQHQRFVDGFDEALAGRYLVEELAADRPRFLEGEGAGRLRSDFLVHLDTKGHRGAFDQDLQTLEGDPPAAYRLALAWLTEFAPTRGTRDTASIAEAAAGLVLGQRLDRAPSSSITHAVLEGLLGSHPRIQGGTLEIRIDELGERLEHFRRARVPRFRAFREARHRLIEDAARRLRLDALQPRVLTSFVRNKLIDQVYLPLIGDNLSKQLGAAGDAKRTDLMGMLLLVSPPGYGKTTLMEYVASRLGMVFMKVNGPSLGHQVQSLDPAEAPNATARQEVEKVNLAFEMANNVMLYLDDIQHTHPEFLQKFISLCDGQRRVEGVWRGHTQTYDLRGKKFCVVMAGNPYTESGAKFQIPDMLANRADTYNLGDVLSGREEVFALSYLENALTSSPVLGPMASRSLEDMHLLIHKARGESVQDSAFDHDWSSVQVEEAVSTLRHLFSVQEILLTVNMEYITSASQDDRFRTEPPFKLQGSYRNMNKLAERVAPAMNTDELEELVTDHYRGESQTLTSGAEANLLKLAELRGRLTAAEAERWASIKTEFRRLQVAGGGDDDPATRITSVLAALGSHLEGIRAALQQTEGKAQMEPAMQAVLQTLARLNDALHRVSEPKLAVSVKSEPPAGLDGVLTRPLETLERTFGPLARSALATQEETRRLWPALTELVELLRVHVLSTPLAFPHLSPLDSEESLDLDRTSSGSQDNG